MRKFIIYTSGAAATFYTTSAFVAFAYPPYHDFFIEQVPLGASFLQYAEDHEWDTLSVDKVITLSSNGYAYVKGLINGEDGQSAIDKTKEVIERTKEVSKRQIKSVSQSVRTTVHKAEEKLGQSSKEAAIGKHKAIQFTEGVEELIRRAEDALAGKAPSPTPSTTTTPSQPAVTPPDAEITKAAPAASNIYDRPLPLGFEPPPGYAKAAPAKPAKATPPPPADAPKAAPEPTPAPAPVPLPLVAPVVLELGASEPVISQLASVIDNLASYLNTNPAAAEKARDVLDGAKTDIKQLADRFEQVKEEERKGLEAKLDEQTREYTIKLLELEMEAQDKLDSQEQGFRQFFEEEKAKFIEGYRAKLNKELQTQSEIINERCVKIYSWL